MSAIRRRLTLCHFAMYHYHHPKASIPSWAKFPIVPLWLYSLCVFRSLRAGQKARRHHGRAPINSANIHPICAICVKKDWVHTSPFLNHHSGRIGLSSFLYLVYSYQQQLFSKEEWTSHDEQRKSIAICTQHDC